MQEPSTQYPRMNVRLRFEERRLLEHISEHASGSLSEALRAGLRLIESHQPASPMVFECACRPQGEDAQTLCGFMISHHDQALINDTLNRWKAAGVHGATVTNFARTAIALLAEELPELALVTRRDALSQRAAQLEAEMAQVQHALRQLALLAPDNEEHALG